ncbi:MAG: hypothetical protein IPM42_16065 [Saprospiraceae bacterium]|nr:hypothetical protein [Saprospiraceae bacterium]
MSATDFVIISSINISGNNKTNPEVIHRELDFKTGDTIMLADFASRLQLNEKRLLSTGLFTLADLNAKNWDVENSTAEVLITLQENWYLYPYFIFELADRNFDVWRKEFDYSFERVNYGIGLKHINLTGMNDKLSFKFQRGYTHKYELKYDYPYLRNGWGLTTGILYKTNKEVNYQTINDKPAFGKSSDERKLFSQLYLSAGIFKRNSALLFQTLKLEFLSAKADEFVLEELNPNFFSGNKTNFKSLRLVYDLLYDKRLYPFYPLGGYKFGLNVSKFGLGLKDDLNTSSISVNAEYTLKLQKQLFLTSYIKSKANIQRTPLPFIANRAIGYNDDVVTGYQLYVIDGMDFLLQRNALKWRLLDKNFSTSSKFPAAFRKMNTKIFLRLNADFAYVNEPRLDERNQFNNRWVYGYGPAVDFVLYNYIKLTCEYGINQKSEKGFYFRSDINF